MLQSIRLNRMVGSILAVVTLTFGSLMVMVPLVWMVSTSLKAEENATAFPPQWIPRDNKKVEIDGRSRFLYYVDIDGETRQLALLKKRPGGKGLFANPDNPQETFEADLNENGRVTEINLHWENFPRALTKVPFLRYVYNTMIIVLFTLIGMLVSCVPVAYGFSRFRARGLNLMFLLLLSTIMLPAQVTLIPQFVMFQKIGWYDTYLPIIVPAFFANAWDVFLLRQFFMTIPLELDDAAKIDGAGVLGNLFYIIIPQSWAVIATVSIFHFLWAWNEFFLPLIYLRSQDKWTIALGLQSFQALYTRDLTGIMSASIITLIPCILLFFFAQRLFIQGVVISGIKG